MSPRLEGATDDQRLREMASSLRRRHFEDLLKQWRHAIRQLQEARRSRRRRARLIRLARKHRLRRCLKKLRSSSSMTLETSGNIPFFYTDRSISKYNLADLAGRIQGFRQFCAELKTLPLDPVIANLRTLLEDAEIESEQPLRVRFLIDSVELDRVWIGNLEVLLNLETFEVRVSNRSADADSHGGYPHPHVNANGEVCWNEHDIEAREYHAAGDFLALRDLIENLLRTYNPHSPYINLEDWVHGLGATCYECGERWPEEDLAYSESLEESLCPNCRMLCDRCDHYVPDRHYDSSFDVCDDCVKADTQECGLCGERCWKTDLQSITTMDEEDEPITTLACEECREAHERVKEGEEEEDYDWKNVVHNDDPDPLRLLAPPMAVPSNPM